MAVEINVRKYEVELIKRLLTENKEDISNVSTDLFQSQESKLIFGILSKMNDRGISITQEKLKIELQTRGHQNLVSVFTTNPDPHIDFESSYFALKKYKNFLVKTETIQKLHESNDEDIIGILNDALLEIDTGEGKKAKANTDIFDDMIREAKTLSNLLIKTGLELHDKKIHYLPDRLSVIAGGSGMGKTAYLIWLLNQFCLLNPDKIEIALFSIEMNEVRIMERLFSIHSQLDVKAQRRAFHRNNFNTEFLIDFRQKLEKMPFNLYYDTLNYQRLAEFSLSFLKRCLAKKKIPILMIDHIGEVDGFNEEDNKRLTDKITKIVKVFAIKGGLAIILSQLTKALEAKENSKNLFRPANSYLMNSHSVQSRADMIELLWRPIEYNIPKIRTTKENYIEVLNTTDSVCIINSKNREDKAEDLWFDCLIDICTFKDFSKEKIEIVPKTIE